MPVKQYIAHMKEMPGSCNTKDCFLCRFCEPEWLGVVTQNKKNFRFAKGEKIFEEGTPVTGIYFVYRGVVKVHKRWGNEKDLIMRFATDGDMLGHRGISDGAVYPVSATALQPTVICFMNSGFLQSTININHGFTAKLMMFYARELQATEQRMHMLVHMDIKGRIANNLLALKQQFGVDNKGYLDLILSRQDLASFAGTTYESVFRVLNGLIKDKIIYIKGKNIKLMNEAALQAFAKGG